MDHEKGSFDYKVIDETITKALNKRSQLDNTVQVAMPFVKATTTIQHPKLLGNGNIGFTLGLHAINEDVKYEDIYSGKKNTPLIGYTYKEDGSTERVYAFNPEEENDKLMLSIFDRNASLFSSTDFTRIPPPGITNVTVSKVKSGILASADIDITVPSLIQLESLHRLFMVPGIGMVLEWGQQFAQERKDIDYSEKPNISEYMFPWNNRAKAQELMKRLGDKQIGLQEILDEYVYKSEGQYQWMFGRVANFSVKSNSDGSSTCKVKIVGPSEDSWAYTTKATVIPAKSKDPSAKFYCSSDTKTVYGYFAETTTSDLNLKSLLDSVYTGKNLQEWRDHVQRFEHTNKPEEPKPNDPTAKISEKTFADSEDAYFMSWRFFVNVVLNHEKFGVRAIFEKAIPDEAKKIGMLLPYADGPTRQNKQVAQLKQIDDPMESYVGMNKFLRSINPSTLIIVNEMAAKLAEQNPQYNIPGAKENFLNPEHKIAKAFLNSNAGRFDLSAQKYNSKPTDPDRGFLSSGVWVNHKAVVECFISADTILRGITNLLDRMNQATGGYWELTIDTAEPIKEFGNSYDYMVVDANRRESSDKAVSKFIDKVHIFNKYVRVDKKEGKLVGSELIDCAVDLSLPKRLFSQIATLGLVQPADMQLAMSGSDTEGLVEKTPRLSDPNDALRKMFAITSLAEQIDGKYPDLTIPEKVLRKDAIKASSICGASNTQLTAQTAGQGNTGGKTSADQLDSKQNADFEKQKADAQKWLDANKATCDKCTPCIQQQTSPGAFDLINFFKQNPWSAAFVSYVMKQSGTSFPASAGHSTYAQTLKDNKSFGWETLNPANTKPQSGDIIVSNRAGSNNSFSSTMWSGLGHGDIVISIGGNKALSIGGNISNKVNYQEYSLDANGYVSRSDAFVILRPPSKDIGKIVSAAANELNEWKGKGWTESNPAAFNKLNTYYAGVNLPLIPNTASSTASSSSTQTCNDTLYKSVGGGNVETGKKACDDCSKRVQIVKQAEAKEKETQGILENKIRQFYGLEQIFRYVEAFPDYMIAQIADSANGDLSNAFGSSPGSLAIKADITLPGINGLRVGELFWIDRIPAFYKAFGAFQIMNIEDKITVDGWTTVVHAQFNFLGNAWKAAMAKKLAGGSTTPSTDTTSTAPSRVNAKPFTDFKLKSTTDLFQETIRKSLLGPRG